jgi:hypothetical protein
MSKLATELVLVLNPIHVKAGLVNALIVPMVMKYSVLHDRRLPADESYRTCVVRRAKLILIMESSLMEESHTAGMLRIIDVLVTSSSLFPME